MFKKTADLAVGGTPYEDDYDVDDDVDVDVEGDDESEKKRTQNQIMQCY